MKPLHILFRIATFLALASTATAVEPAWWAERDVTTTDPSSNYSPATLGQAKWMAHQAIVTLQSILPDVASQIDGDLTSGSNPILQNGWTVPSNSDENLAVLTIGQLKALAHPFHARLSAAGGNEWMNDHLLSRGLPASAGDPGLLHGDFLAADGVYYPWKLVQSLENRAKANLGQLKLCFDLPLTEDSESPPDGLPDLWEYAVVHANPPGGTWTDIGLIHAGNAAQAASETGMTEHPNSDTQGGGSEVETPDWFTLTGNGVENEAITETQTFTIKRGKSRMLVVGMASEEYPLWTSDQSKFNDLLEWEITSKIGPNGPDIDVATDSLDVNILHNEWDLANFEGITLRGFSPAHLEKISVIHAPGEADVTVTVKLTVTNFGDDILPSTLMVGLIPVEVADNKFATGVDRISKTAHSDDIGFQKDFWIMAPAGSPPSGGDCENDTKIFIPLDDSVDLLIDADKATANPKKINLITENDEATADTDETLNKVVWHGTSADSGENVVEWKFGPNEPEQDLLPIKVMTMKNRPLKVAVHYVTGKTTLSSGTVRLHEPEARPDAETIKAKLYDVFSQQINTRFSSLECIDHEIAWDIGEDADWGSVGNVVSGNEILPFNLELNTGGWVDLVDPISVEEQKFLAVRRADAKINIIVVGGCRNIVDYIGYNGIADRNDGGQITTGLTKRGLATIYIAGESMNESNPVSEDLLLQHIAHEIGHVFVGPGHPNDESEGGIHGGVAPLKGTSRLERLMFSDEQVKKNLRLSE
jgi:hypothetical protein